MPTHMLNMCYKFRRNQSIKYRDITSRVIIVDGRTTDGRTEGRPQNKMPQWLQCIMMV